jgi:predicted lipoprotein
MRRTLGPWFPALALLASCGAPPAEDPVLRHLALEVILPDYRRFAEAAEQLRGRAAPFAARPSPETLSAVRAAWKEARRAWGVCRAHLLGPEAERFLESKIDTSPVLRDRLEELVRGSGPLTAEAAERWGGNVKGFMALEYLLFDGPEGPSAAEAVASSPRRGELIRALTENLAAVAAEIRVAWEPEGGNFAGNLARAGLPGSSFVSRSAAVDALMNRLILFSERTTDGRLGLPLGALRRKPGPPDPGLVESTRSGHSVEDLLADVEGMRRLYHGTTEAAGLGARARRMNPDLDRAIAGALAEAREALSRIPGPLHEALVRDVEPVRAAYRSLKELHARIAVDLVAVHEATLMVVPFDGD